MTKFTKLTSLLLLIGLLIIPVNYLGATTTDEVVAQAKIDELFKKVQELMAILEKLLSQFNNLRLARPASQPSAGVFGGTYPGVGSFNSYPRAQDFENATVESFYARQQARGLGDSGFAVASGAGFQIGSALSGFDVPTMGTLTQVDPSILQVPTGDFKIIDRPLGNASSRVRSQSIDTIVLHQTACYMDDLTAMGLRDPNKKYSVYDLDCVLAIFQKGKFGPHYIIDQESKAYRLVAEKDIANHAGKSKMPDGRENVNDFSIGIEILYWPFGKDDSGNTHRQCPSEFQYQALKKLIADIRTRHNIKYIISHKEIGTLAGRPDVHTDPQNLDWAHLTAPLTAPSKCPPASS